MQFLATLHSQINQRAGIGIVDSERGLVYLQVEKLPSWIINPQLRVMEYHGDELYITSPAAIQVYVVENEFGEPFFKLKKSITLPEWVLGTNLQADLLAILVSSNRKQLLVANNLFNAIDELSIAGEFVKRHFLHEIAPDLFPVPDMVEKAYRYGHVRQITETFDGSVLLTISNMHGTDAGCVLNFDTGQIFLNNLERPHGGFSDNGKYFIQEVAKGQLSVYPIDFAAGVAGEKIWDAKPKINNPLFEESIQNMRGMLYTPSSIYCGVCHWGKTSKSQIPARIVSFDSRNGRQQTTEIFFPDLDDFREARVFSLAPLPSSLNDVEIKDFKFYLEGDATEPIPFLAISESAQPAEDQKTKPEENEEAKPVVNLVEKKDADIKSVTNLAEKKEPDIKEKKQTPSIILENVTLAYPRSKSSLFSFKKQNEATDDFTALNGVSFTLFEGETVGIIGRNGSGKSTISMMVAGSLQPDKGVLRTYGRAQLLSIGLGFQNEQSGRDNVFINGALLGLSKKEISTNLPEIEKFAELEDFMDEPVRTYSAGMRSRLAFAVATAVNPDILILDEVMSTGDAAFRKKADERMKSMRERTKTVIIVSHSIGLVKKMCSRVVWLHKGEVIMDGTPETVCPEYDTFCKDPQKWIKK